MIDLDNAIIAPPNKCLAFSILRYAFSSPTEQPSAEVLTQEVNTWQEAGHLRASVTKPQLNHAMVWLETEKVLRILYRWIETNSYFEMVHNIPRLHLRNLEILRASAHA